MEMKIVPTQRVDWPPPYKDATEQVFGAGPAFEGSSFHDRIRRGQPFALVDPTIPMSLSRSPGTTCSGQLTSDDYDLRFFECNAHYISRGKGTSLELDDTEVGHYAGYSEIGRTEVEPMPVDPDFKNTGGCGCLRSIRLSSLHAARRGSRTVPLCRPKRGDDSWSYTVGARRVRRLNEAVLSDATGISAWNPDHYSGFNPKTEAYDYKFLGEKQMLACVHAEHSPRFPVRPTAVRVPAPRRGNIVIYMCSRPSPGTASSILCRAEHAVHGL